MFSLFAQGGADQLADLVTFLIRGAIIGGLVAIPIVLLIMFLKLCGFFKEKLVKCKLCGKEVSNYAESCPHCGGNYW